MTAIERILNLMKAKDVNALNLEKALGFSNATISSWKSGKAKPSTDALTKIAKYFDVSVDYLLGLSEVPKPDYTIPPELEKVPIAFYEGLKDLSQEEIDTVNRIVQSFVENKKK